MVTKAQSAAGQAGADVSDYVIAVIDNPWEAARAEEALRGARFDDDQIVVLGGWRTQARERVRHRRATADRFVALLEAQESVALLEHLLRQVRQAHAVLAVYAPEPQAFERAISVLEGHHAHAV